MSLSAEQQISQIASLATVGDVTAIVCFLVRPHMGSHFHRVAAKPPLWRRPGQLHLRDYSGLWAYDAIFCNARGLASTLMLETEPASQELAPQLHEQREQYNRRLCRTTWRRMRT
ncbi:hypothetical protein BU26DRAFT_603547 [Trematosphaeria pertusa]|uniref:Uncharacterized protein n=1 Tax=Trematosphaeria pertusa TaxID=390896 RepID=A0A6A6ILG8_9PLEO|nr:uncharacterized protein BU26DRAFT_603547 [Trematosphaeria pertusa]KAF2251057.1 hypothetical protein BU26DRAFT_603547 [Trematosphaeria pertusa]